jgi:hypothetical protein
VLSALVTNSFVANQSKCKFGCDQVDYLGHIISGAGVAVDPDKVKCILAWPEPKNVKGFRGFLGLTGYYRKFIKDYGKLAKRLTELTKKDNFYWNEETNKDLQHLKRVMMREKCSPSFPIPCGLTGRGF